MAQETISGVNLTEGAPHQRQQVDRRLHVLHLHGLRVQQPLQGAGQTVDLVGHTGQ